MGVQVRIIDRDMDLPPFPKAIAIQPRFPEIMQMSGLIDQFLELGLPMTDFRFYIIETCKILIKELDKMDVQIDRGWELLDTEFVEDSGHTFVETIIRTALPGEIATPDNKFVTGDVDVFAKHTQKEYEMQVVRSEYLVSADGARSTVRYKLSISFPGRTRSHKTIMWDGTYECDLDLASITFIHGVNKTPMVSFQLPSGARRITVEAGEIEPDEDFSKTLQDLTTDKLEELVNDCIAPAKFKVKETNWLTIFKVNERHAENFVHKNRIFLAGDSAHVQSPSGRQGLNTGWHDAHNLAWKLAERHQSLGYDQNENYLHPVVDNLSVTEAFGLDDEAYVLDVLYQKNTLNKSHATQAAPTSRFQVGVCAQDVSLRLLRAVIGMIQDSESIRLHELTAGIGCFHILIFASDMLNLRTDTAGATEIKGVSTTTAKELKQSVEKYLSIWRSKWSYVSNMLDGHKDQNLFKVHDISGSAVLGESEEMINGNDNRNRNSVKSLADKRMGDVRIYMDDTKIVHNKYGFASSQGAGDIVVIRPDSQV
ncbi:hypothetical protein BGZ99_000393 [Dissophora globulifera]|uniref:FAD-binding domain-containing protein n=1 Tax=Dissophora globulifera TaxID=979702 RepID=A0A9P6R3H4_9FUNG|nr:hypothetical protein BGZ99_000393 [Dissophora globulifera]